MNKYLFVLIAFVLVFPFSFALVENFGEGVACEIGTIAEFSDAGGYPIPAGSQNTLLAGSPDGLWFVMVSDTKNAAADTADWFAFYTIGNRVLSRTNWTNNSMPLWLNRGSPRFLSMDPFSAEIVTDFSESDGDETIYVSLDAGEGWVIVWRGMFEPVILKHMYTGADSAGIFAVSQSSNKLQRFAVTPQNNYDFFDFTTVGPAGTGFYNIVSFPDGNAFLLGINESGHAQIYKSENYHLQNWERTTILNDNGEESAPAGTPMDITQANGGLIAWVNVGLAETLLLLSQDGGDTWTSFSDTIDEGSWLVQTASNETGANAVFGSGKIYWIPGLVELDIGDSLKLYPIGGELPFTKKGFKGIAATNSREVLVSSSEPQGALKYIKCNLQPFALVNDPAASSPLEIETRAFVPLTLDASISQSLDGGEKTYSWKHVAGPPLNFGGNATEEGIAEVAPNEAGEYNLTVMVSDNDEPVVEGSTFAVHLTVLDNSPPEITTPPQVSCIQYQECTLNAIIADHDGDNFTVFWASVEGMPAISWTTAQNAPTAKFIPEESGLYGASVTATDEWGAPSQKSNVLITVEAAPEPEPECGNGTCESNLGESNANCSDDCPAEEPAAECGNGECESNETNASCPIDCQPEPLVPIPGEDQAPVIEANENISGTVGTDVSLEAIAVDPEGTPVSYSWSQLVGPTVSLLDQATRKPHFVPQEAGSYVFQVTASDVGGNASYPKVVVVIVNEAAIGQSGEGQPREPAPAPIDPLVAGAVAAAAIVVAGGYYILKYKPKTGFEKFGAKSGAKPPSKPPVKPPKKPM